MSKDKDPTTTKAEAADPAIAAINALSARVDGLSCQIYAQDQALKRAGHAPKDADFDAAAQALRDEKR